MFKEICNIISCLIFSAGIGVFISYLINMWYSYPLKEEEGGSILYISKEINFNE